MYRATKNFGALRDANDYLNNVLDKTDKIKEKYYKAKHKVNRVGNAITRKLTGYDQPDINALNKRAGLSNLDIIKKSMNKNSKDKMDEITGGVKRAAYELNNSRNLIS